MTTEAHEQSKAVWDEMAAGWDRYRDHMRAVTGHVSRWLAEKVEAREGDTILDLAAGPGDNGFLVAPVVGAEGKVLSTDFSQQMVEVARAYAERHGLPNVEARTLDAQDMDLADDSVDGIICRWGFMLMVDPAAAFKECRRVLKDGRKLAVSVWGGPEDNPWVTVPGMTMMQMGHQPGRDPFGPGGMFSLADHDTIRSMVSGAGFASVEIEPMPVEYRFDSFVHAWDYATHVAGAIAALVKELPPDEVERFRVALEDAYQPYRTDDGGLSIPGLTINVVAS